MKSRTIVLFTSVIVAVLALASCSDLPFHGSKTGQSGHFLHGAAEGNAAASPDNATISIRQEDGPLCDSQFYRDLYALTAAEFAVGAENVNLDDYTEKVFALIRAADEFAGGAEAFIEHVKAVPAQLVDIIAEDTQVLDSCYNFSVALVGPP